MSATFQLDEQDFFALNGGPMFKFREAISFFVNCETQKWMSFGKKLSAGGQESYGGWLKDSRHTRGNRQLKVQISNQRSQEMRFMMIVKASRDSEAAKMPSHELLAAMGKYTDDLMKAGVLLDLSELHPGVCS